MPLLEAHQITLNFGGLTAIRDLDLTIEPSTIASLIGPNGAGKTTLFNIFTGLYQPDAGELWFEGRNITGSSVDRFARMGIARTFQNIRLFPNMTVLDNILVGQHARLKTGLIGAMMRSPRFVQSEQQARQRALHWLNYVGLPTHLHSTIAKTLSYGQQRRLEIARALAAQPKLLLLDEPTAGMNPQETAAIAGLIRQLRDDLQLTILLIEHDMSVVMNLSERISVMDYGSKIAEGVPSVVRADPKVIAAYLGE